MAKGRPPDLLFDPDHPGPVVQAVAQLGDRGRLTLPKKIVENVPWISRTKTSFALAVLGEPGVVRLHSWEMAAEILQRRRKLIEQSRSEPGAIELLRVLEDRYKRFQIPVGARPTLTAEMILHLGLPPVGPIAIYLWRIGTAIELVSSVHRGKELAVEWDEFSNLPH